MHPDDRERVLAAEVESFQSGTDYENEFRMVTADGRVVWVWERDNVIRDERGQPICSQGVLMDITQLRGTQRALSESEARAQRYLDVAATMIVVLDERGEISLVNRRACEVLGYSEEELTGSSWFGLVVPAHERAAAREVFGQLLSGDVASADENENHVISKSGEQRLIAWHNTILRDERGCATGTLSSGEDITERHQAQERVAYVAYHDPLTGLPNRARLAERIAASVVRAQHTGASVGLLCRDIDDFKVVNDSLGHALGDELLAAVGKRLAATGRHDDMLGRAGHRLYAPEKDDPLERLSLTARLRRSLEHHELVLHYQPIYALNGPTRPVGVEALLRWEDPDHGLGSPALLIPAGEHSGLIEPIGAWVVDELCRQGAEWESLGLTPRLSVNASPRELRRAEYPDTFARALSRRAIDPERVVIEVTESAAMDEVAGAGLIERLHGLGVGLAIDDFGEGFSSLSRLRQLPVEQLKIDRSFMREVPHNEEAAAVVGAIIRLAEALGREVVAEGVETEEQREFLASEGCPLAQGFHLSRPLPADEVTELLLRS